MFYIKRGELGICYRRYKTQPSPPKIPTRLDTKEPRPIDGPRSASKFALVDDGLNKSGRCNPSATDSLKTLALRYSQRYQTTSINNPSKALRRALTILFRVCNHQSTNLVGRAVGDTKRHPNLRSDLNHTSLL
jgi:hypothetical protein